VRYYFDWAATAIPDEESTHLEAGKIPFGNPSSLHKEGREARLMLEDARERAAKILNVRKEQLYWTSGASEANSIVLFSFFRRFLKTGGRLLVGKGEHPSVLENCKIIESLGCPVVYAGLNPEGSVSEENIKALLEKHSDINFVSLMAANNETGALTNVASAARLIREASRRKAHIHSDMVQSLGKIPPGEAGSPFDALESVDSASFSGHKIGAARGAGLLYLKRPLEVLVSGGGQEGGVRSGTENLAAICSFAASLERHCSKERAEKNYAAAEERMSFLITALKQNPACKIVPECRSPIDRRFSPYILQCSIKGLPGEAASRMLDDLGFAVSTGSACYSNKRGGKKRYVLAAMGIDEETAFNSIRISQGFSTTMEEIKQLIAALAALRDCIT